MDDNMETGGKVLEKEKPMKRDQGKGTSLKAHLSSTMGKSPMDFFKRMCENISVHGFSLIGIAVEHFHPQISPGEKKLAILKLILAVVILLSSTGLLLWYLVNILTEYRHTYLTVGLADAHGPLKDAYFPDITICNNNKVKMSFLLKIDSTNLNNKNKTLLKEINDYFITGSATQPSAALNQFLTRPEFLAETKAALPAKAAMMTSANVKGFFRQAAAPTCKDMILQTYWKNKIIDLVIKDDMVEATNFGICCKISPSKLFNDSNSVSARPEDGLSLLIDSESYDYAYTPHHAEGFKFSAGSPQTFNQVEQDGQMVHPGSNTYGALIPKVITLGSTRPVDYNWTPEERKCYIKDMNKMPGMKELQKNHPRLANVDKNGDFDYRLCRELIKLEEINTKANCTPPEYWEIINDDNDAAKLPILEPCLGPQIYKAEQIAKNMKSTRGDQLCLRNCETQENIVSLSFSDYPAKALFEDLPEYKLIDDKINKAYATKKILMDKYFKTTTRPAILKYTKENLAWLTVYFKFPYVRKYSADVAKTRHALLAEVGGTCGLFLGISFIGILELAYHTFKIVMGVVTPNKSASLASLNLM